MFHRDHRLKEFTKIEKLLYGTNYSVWFNIYGPANSELSLDDSLKELISVECEVFKTFHSTPDDAISKIREMILYEGLSGSQPLELEKKRDQVLQIMDEVFSKLNIRDADLVVDFSFGEGHPAYPVFWDFAFDIHIGNDRWIFVGCSSD